MATNDNPVDLMDFSHLLHIDEVDCFGSAIETCVKLSVEAVVVRKVNVSVVSPVFSGNGSAEGNQKTLFPGVLVDRYRHQASLWASSFARIF